MNLAPYACSDLNSRGRQFDEPAPVHRNQYQRDRDRIIHSYTYTFCVGMGHYSESNRAG